MSKIGQLRTRDGIEVGMREIRGWLSKIDVNGLSIDLKYDAGQNVALVKFKYKNVDYEFRSTKQSNCRLNMHAIARVMESKVRSHLMGIEDFSKSMTAYASLPNYSSEQSSASFEKISEKHYAILGLTSLESNQEIKNRYRQLCKTFHPDMALSDEAKAEFSKKFNEINQAYAEICKERNIQ